MKRTNLELLVFLFVFILSLHQARGQNTHFTDSLKAATHNETDLKKLADNYILIAENLSTKNTDSIFLYIDYALKTAKKINYKEGIAEAYFMQSYSYDLIGEYPKSISSMEKAIPLFEELGNSSYLSACYNNLGVLYSYGTEQIKSLEYFIKAIQNEEEDTSSFSLGAAYSNVASFYEEQKEYSSALKYFKKALEIDKHFNVPQDIAVSYLDVAQMNTKLLRYKDALVDLEKAKELMSQIHDDYFNIVLLQRFSTYYKETDELNRADSLIQVAQQLSLENNYPMSDAETLSIKGEILLKQKKYKKSIAVLDSAIAQYKSIDAPGTFNELYKFKSNAYFGLGLYPKAFQFLQLAEEESLESNKIAEILNEFEKQEALKAERKRQTLEQELEKQQNENALIKVRSKLYTTIFVAIFLGIIFLVALVLYLLKQSHNKTLKSNYELINHQKEVIEKNYSDLQQSEKRLAELNATKDKFFSIIAHDLKNPFNTLIGISEMMIQNPEIRHTEDFEELLEGMFQTAQSGHDLLENLLEWSRSQIGHINYKPQVISLDEIFESTATFFEQMAKAKNITISVQPTNDQKVCADYNMVKFVVRNLVNNAIKFSNPNNTVTVFSQSSANKTIVTVEDNGIGISTKILDKLFKIEHSVQKKGTANEKGTGLGLILCKEFVEKNGGEIWVESIEKQGSKFSFSLPLSCGKNNC